MIFQLTFGQIYREKIPKNTFVFKKTKKDANVKVRKYGGIMKWPKQQAKDFIMVMILFCDDFVMW